MTITEYSKLIERTNPYDNREAIVYNWLKDIIRISTKMNYKDALEKVCNILDNYGSVKTGKIDGRPVAYLIIDAPVAIKEQIRNIKFHVEDQQERDFSEKILNIR